MITISDWLAHHITTRGLTTARVAERLGMSTSRVGMWRAGRNDINRHIINELCDWWELDDSERLRALSLPVTVDEDSEPEAVAA